MLILKLQIYLLEVNGPGQARPDRAQMLTGLARLGLAIQLTNGTDQAGLDRATKFRPMHTSNVHHHALNQLQHTCTVVISCTAQYTLCLKNHTPITLSNNCHNFDSLSTILIQKIINLIVAELHIPFCEKG